MACWVITFVIVAAAAPWLSGFCFAMLQGASPSMAVYMGLAMIAYSSIISIPLAIITSLLGMVFHEIDKPLSKGAMIGGGLGIAISIVFKNLLGDDILTWASSLISVGTVVGMVEAWLWGRLYSPDEPINH